MKRFSSSLLNEFIGWLFKYPQVILSILGICLACLGYSVQTFVPEKYAGSVWFLLGMILIFNGTGLGLIIRKLYVGVYTDKLTSIGNRSLFYVRMGIVINKVQAKKSTCFSLAMIDVDNFKKINDNYGHNAGDAVLTELAKVFKDNIRSVDTVVRWGGEEFAIVIVDADRTVTQRVLERVRQAVEQHDFGSISATKVTVSIGCVTYQDVMNVVEKQEDAYITEQFVELADKALYEAKKIKNTVVNYAFMA